MPFYRDQFPRSTPRQATGGIKAQSGRGRFANNWWSQRWIAVLESFKLGSRLTRGRAYARSGQVLSINIAPGIVNASVQGSRATPYKVGISIKEITDAEWKKLSEAVFSQALIASKLLAGEMPEDLEKYFEQAGVSLFPQEYGDLRTGCSCPDWANPCKHTAAVYYLLAEEFDRSPMLLLTMRGITKERLMAHLGASQRAAVVPKVIVIETLPTDAKSFWGASGQVVVPAVQAPSVGRSAGTAALTRQLGSVPFWRGEENFQAVMERIYADVSKAAAMIELIGDEF
jgi:uncharacterized Zn finger protein